MARNVAIVGAALSECGTVPDKTSYQLIQEASAAALADAGVSDRDVDGFGGHGTTLPPVELSEYLGLRPSWIDSTNVGGSSWEVLAQHAASAIVTGDAEVVLLAYGSTARSNVRRGRRTGSTAVNASGPLQFEAPFGASLIAKYAMVAQRHMHEFGTTIDELAEIALAARAWAAFNPQAPRREPLTVEEVHSARMIAEPFTTLHCCLRSDGGGAIVLTSEERARDCATRPVHVLGSAHAVSHASMSQWDDLTTTACTRSGPRALGQAGLTVDDIDVCQIYDSFTATVLLSLEDLGFCKKGDGGAFVADGKLGPGGALPANTDGGGLSFCHPGMRGMFLLVEAVRQLRGDAGEAQVPGAEVCLVNAMGGFFSVAATMILGRG